MFPHCCTAMSWECQPWPPSSASLGEASNMKLYEESEMQEGATTGGPEAQELTLLTDLRDF